MKSLSNRFWWCEMGSGRAWEALCSTAAPLSHPTRDEVQGNHLQHRIIILNRQQGTASVQQQVWRIQGRGKKILIVFQRHRRYFIHQEELNVFDSSTSKLSPWHSSMSRPKENLSPLNHWLNRMKYCQQPPQLRSWPLGPKYSSRIGVAALAHTSMCKWCPF